MNDVKRLAKSSLTIKKPRVRRTWKRNPRTRVKEDERAYRRPRAKQEVRKAISEVSEG